MPTPHSYDVKVWKIQTRYKTDNKGNQVPARYIVRWIVDGARFEPSFRTFAQADSLRSELMAAMRNGEAFDTESGYPVSRNKGAPKRSVYELACSYADMKWDNSSPKYRSGIAYALTTITLAAVCDDAERPSFKQASRALRKAFNRNQRGALVDMEQEAILRQVERNSRQVSDFAKPEVLRGVLGELSRNQDGKKAAPDTVRLRRIALGGLLDYAVEQALLPENPLHAIKVPKHKVSLKQVDRRSVVNPVQARTLLRAVREGAPALHAFFGLLYFAGLRPEEAVNLRKHNLSLPSEGWGEIHLEKASPEVGAEWTDTGDRGEERGLKHRGDDIGRVVPCSDELTAILHEHLKRFGTAPDGRLFRGVRDGGYLSSTVYGRAWAAARERAFTADVAASPLAKRPYDLRHACVSTWLNATNDPTRVADWAGHSVGVLMRVYAKCLDGGEQHAREQVARRLRGL